MPSLSKYVEGLLYQRCLQHHVVTVEQFLAREGITLAQELGLSIEEVNRMKLKIAYGLLGFLSCNEQQVVDSDQPSVALSILPPAIPDHNAALYRTRLTGIQSVDQLLCGAIPSSAVINIIGGSGSGKTHLALSSIITCALNNQKVVVVNSNNDISLKQIQIHLERRLLDPVQQRALGISTDIQRQRLLPQTLANIYYYSAFDVWTLLDVLCEVSSAIGRIDVLVIDSLYSLIAPIMNHNNNYYSSHMLQRSRTGSDHLQTIEVDVALQYNAIMAQLGLLFKKLSSDPISQTTVIMTNSNPCCIISTAANLMPNTSTLFTTEQQCIGLENCLGPLWSMVDVTLLLAVKQIGRRAISRGAAIDPTEALVQQPTIISVSKFLAPPYMKSQCNDCEFCIY